MLLGRVDPGAYRGPVEEGFPTLGSGAVQGKPRAFEPLPLGSILSRAFPASVQAYWDEVLEPLFAALPGARPLPAAATVGVLAVGDVLLSAGFVAYAFAELLKWSGVGIALVCAGCTVIQQQRKKKASSA